MRILDVTTGEDITEAITPEHRKRLEDVQLTVRQYNPGKLSKDERNEILRGVVVRANRIVPKSMFFA